MWISIKKHLLQNKNKNLPLKTENPHAVDLFVLTGVASEIIFSILSDVKYVNFSQSAILIVQ